MPYCWEECSYGPVWSLLPVFFEGDGILLLYTAMLSPILWGQIFLKAVLAFTFIAFVVSKKISRDIVVKLSIILVIFWSSIVYFSYYKYVEIEALNRQELAAVRIAEEIKEKEARDFFKKNMSLGMSKDEVITLLRVNGIKFEPGSYNGKILTPAGSLQYVDSLVLEGYDPLFFDLNRRILVHYGRGYSMSLEQQTEFIKDNFPKCSPKLIYYTNTGPSSPTCWN